MGGEIERSLEKAKNKIDKELFKNHPARRLSC